MSIFPNINININFKHQKIFETFPDWSGFTPGTTPEPNARIQRLPHRRLSSDILTGFLVCSDG